MTRFHLVKNWLVGCWGGGVGGGSRNSRCFGASSIHDDVCMI